MRMTLYHKFGNIKFGFLVWLVLVLKPNANIWSEEIQWNLEGLWNLIEEKNIEVIAAQREDEIAEFNIDSFWMNFIPQLNFSYSGVCLEELGENSEILPEFSTSMVISEMLPGGLRLELIPKMSFEKNLLNYSEEELLNRNYLSNTYLSVSVTQSLSPFWLQQEQKNPELELKYYSKELAEIYKKCIVFSKIEGFTEAYISLRKVNRNIEITQENINLLFKNLKSFEELRLKGEISWNDYFEKEEQLREYENNLVTLMETKEALINVLEEILSSSESEIKGFLENMEKHELPQIKGFYEKSPYTIYLELEKNIEKINFILEKQNSAPVVTLSGTIPINSENKKMQSKNWTVSTGINLSPWINCNKKLRNQEFENRIKTLEERIQENERKINIDKLKYLKLLKNAENQMESYRKGVENSKKIFDSVRICYLDGKASYYDLLQAELIFKNRKLNFENQMDTVWFYKWMLENRK